MTRLNPVYGIGWQKKVYTIKTLERYSTEFDCVNACLNLERYKCNLFVMDQEKCFLDIMDMINGSIPSDIEHVIKTTTPETVILSNGELFFLILVFWKLIFLKVYCNTYKWKSIWFQIVNKYFLLPFKFLIEILKAALDYTIHQIMTNIQLHKYLYKSISNLNNSTSCGAFCIFDSMQCNFFFVQDGNCFFGNLHSNNSNFTSIEHDEEVTIFGSEHDYIRQIKLQDTALNYSPT